MDRVLEAQWQRKERPFHSETIVLTEFLPLSRLRRVLKSILSHCEIYYPAEAFKFYQFDDWHEHDGYLTERQLICLKDLYAALESDESFRESMPQDIDVCYAVYPESLDFLLRYNLDETEESGDFSFTGYGIDLHEVRKRLSNYPEMAISQRDSKQYFDAIYAG